MDEDVNIFGVLTDFISGTIFKYIEECSTYKSAIETLQNIYVKPTNEIYSEHVLTTRRQQVGETLDEYLQSLKILSKEFNFFCHCRQIL